MTDYKCPNCQCEKTTSEKNTARGHVKLHMILCNDCKAFLGVVNDLSDLINDIRHINAKT